MKTSLTITLLATTVAVAYSQTDRALQSRIVSATVYNDRALVTRVAHGTFTSGRYSVKVPGLPLLLNDQSVRVSGSGTAQATILEVRVETEMLDSVPDARVKELQDKLKGLRDDVQKIDDRAKVISQQRDFLGHISIASTENISRDLRIQRPSVDDWQRVLVFLDANSSRLNTEQRDLDVKKEELQKRIAAAQFDLDRVGSSDQPREKQVIVAVDVAREGELSFDVSYLVQNASWQPLYDLRASTSAKKIDLTYNAMVWQNTGEDWDGVTLTLSTAQPVIGGSQPTLGTWFVDVYGGTKGAIQGFVRDISTGEPLPGANVMIQGTSQGTTTNSDGFFVLLNVAPGDYTLRVTYIGYRSQTVRTTVVPYQTARVDATMESLPVETEGISVLAERPQVQVTRTNALRLMSDLQAGVITFETARLQRGTTSTAYEIASKAAIPSNNTKRKVTIAIVSLPGEFAYSSVPKLQPRVYFKSSVTNSTDFPLLDGSMSVFVDGDYVSNSRMPTVMPGEKFDAFLGVDDGIRINRKTLNRLTETAGFFSKSKRTTYDILTTVENLKKTAEVVSVEDNVPVSRNELIKVAVQEPKSGELEPDAEGRLKWNLNLKPGEKKEIHLKFTVEYPTDMTVSALE